MELKIDVNNKLFYDFKKNDKYKIRCIEYHMKTFHK